MTNPKEILVFVGRMLYWLVMTIYYTLEAVVLWFVPNKYHRKDVSGWVVLVTGGGSGIGQQMCLKLAAKGAVIVTWDISEEGNKETAKLVQEAGGKCHTYTVDLCDRDAVYATADKVKKEVGKVNILINNAGVVTGKPILECSDDNIMNTFNVNSICHFWTTKAFLGDMMAEDKGHIVTIASMAGKIVAPHMVDYCASKHAAVGFHETLTAELRWQGKFGVKTTVVCPFFVATPLSAGAYVRFIPTLDPIWVGDQVVDAILRDVQQLLLPRYMVFMVLMNAFLPQKSIYLLGILMEMDNAMKNFVGRRKND